MLGNITTTEDLADTTERRSAVRAGGGLRPPGQGWGPFGAAGLDRGQAADGEFRDVPEDGGIRGASLSAPLLRRTESKKCPTASRSFPCSREKNRPVQYCGRFPDAEMPRSVLFLTIWSSIPMMAQVVRKNPAATWAIRRSHCGTARYEGRLDHRR